MRHLKGLLAGAGVFFGLNLVMYFLSQGGHYIGWAALLAILAYRGALRMRLALLLSLVALWLASFGGTTVYFRYQSSSVNPATWLTIIETLLFGALFLFIPTCALLRRSIPWRIVQWGFWLGCLLSMIRLSLAGLSLGRIPSYIFNFLPPLLPGLLAWREANAPGSMDGPRRRSLLEWARRLSRHEQVLKSQRGRPTLIRWVQGWVVACYGIFIGLILTFFAINHLSLSMDDMLPVYIILGGAGAVVGARIGRHLRLTTLSIIVLILEGLYAIPSLVRAYYALPMWLHYPNDVSGLVRSTVIANVLSTTLNGLSSLVWLGAFIALIANRMRRRIFPSTTLKWCLWAVASLSALDALVKLVFFMGNAGITFFQMILGPFGYSMIVMSGVAIMPAALLAVALWLEEGRRGFGTPHQPQKSSPEPEEMMSYR